MAVVVVVVWSWLVGSLVLGDGWHDEGLDELVGCVLILALLLALVVFLGLPDVDLEGALTGEWVVSVVELDCALGCADGLIEDVGELGVLADLLTHFD